MRITLAVTCLVATCALPAVTAAATIDYVVGAVEPQDQVRPGRTVSPGTLIRTGPMAIVMIRYPHPTPDGLVCDDLWFVGNGGSHRVENDNRKPRAYTTRAPALPAPDVPFAQAVQGARQGPADGGLGAAQRALVEQSERAWAAFDQWSRQVGVRETRDLRMMDLEIGVDYGGNDLGGPQTVASASACSNLCAANNSCFAMTFVLSQRRCWLKSRAAPEERRLNTDTASARKRPLGAAIAKP